jgi:glycosyltransferase involved in cell wall biosynthesis
MRILHVLGKLDRGGAETWLVQVLRHIDREKYQMDFLVHTTDPGAYDEEVEALGARIIPCLHPSNPALYAKNFFSILKEYGPYDVVHSHVHHYSGYVLMLAALAGVPVRIAHSHSDTRMLLASKSIRRGAYLSAMNIMIRAFASRGLAVSAEAGCDLFSSQWRDRPDKWQLQHLGIDLSEFEIDVDHKEVRRSLGIPLDAFVVGHVGRFCEAKNHRFLIEVGRELIKMESRSVFLLIGDGPLRLAIEEKVREYGLAKYFIFAGLRSDVSTLMKGAMDVFLFPSVYEGLPVTLLEAQAAGLSCLISNVISPETDVVSRLITRVSLDQTPEKWGSRLLEIRDRDRPISSITLTDELESRSIVTSKNNLVAFYTDCLSV